MRARARSVVWTASAQAATRTVAAGGDLQAALNAAQPGDVITLAAGGDLRRQLRAAEQGRVADYITIRSAAPDASLPPAGMRMTPAYARAARRRSDRRTAPRRCARRPARNHWKLMFLEFQANQNGYGDIIALGAGDSTQTQLSQVPYALVLDRVYVHGDPVLGQKRGIALNSSDTDHRQLVRLRLQGGRPGLAGDQRLQRPRQLPDREQLPRGRGRERPVRRRRSG